MLNQFENLSCYEEFEIQCALIGISKVDVLKEIGHKIDNYYYFISEDGIFNWFDLNGNYAKDPGILKELKNKHIHYNIHNNIIKCIIPNSVTSICAWVFAGCESLKEITIPNSVTSICYEAFLHCESLISINIPNSITSIGTRAFYHCESLKEITIPNSVTIIGDWAFYYCTSLKQVIFKGKTLEEVKQMDNYPFGIEDESIIKCEL